MGSMWDFLNKFHEIVKLSVMSVDTKKSMISVNIPSTVIAVWLVKFNNSGNKFPKDR